MANRQDSRQADLISVINAMSAAQFRKNHFDSLAATTAFPRGLSCSFESSKSILDVDLNACLDLVRETSEDAYKASSWGWSAENKRKEMQEPDMKYLLLHDTSETAIRRLKGFLSFMLTTEDDMEVVYCYEIHLYPEMQGRKLGNALMNLMETIAFSAGISIAMLTVFTSKLAARRFYERLGYKWYDEEPPKPRKRLRTRVTDAPKPTYLILLKELG